MKKPILLLQFSLFCSSIILAQNVGIGTITPNANALLHVDIGNSTTKGFLVTGTYNAISTIPDLGAGSRMIFYPGKGAFRAGYIIGTQWNNSNVGVFSTAMGINTIASGSSSTATGAGTTASGSYSTAMGFQTTANGNYSTAMGSNTHASSFSTAMGNNTNALGDGSTAIGESTTASGINSTAMGQTTTASGGNSTAMGTVAIASGNYSTAMGYYTTTSGNRSTAMGSYVNTNFQNGAFIIGDEDPNAEGTTFSGFPNEFVARFLNGFYFLTSGNTSRFGVSIGHNGSFWVAICDKNRKENFEQIDGEDVLRKISQINLTSWNYKQQDSKIYRHYGIMAQDFYSAFGRDKYGTIGNDTTVNPIDMIGIDMTAIQALEKRTERLNAENIELRNEVSTLEIRLKKLEKRMNNK